MQSLIINFVVVFQFSFNILPYILHWTGEDFSPNLHSFVSSYAFPLFNIIIVVQYVV